MSSVWLTSAGLDIDLSEKTKSFPKVNYGELEGTFLSYETKNNKLQFQTNDLDRAFAYLAGDLKSAIISYTNFSHTIQWEQHNYKIAKGSSSTVIITIEDKHEEK